MQKPGPVRDDDDTVRKVPLRNKKKQIFAYAYVDASDFEAVNALKWRMYRKNNSNNEYAMSDMYMHQFLMGAPPDKHVIDHWNGNGLDNRRCNLRFVSRSLNGHNKQKASGTVSKYLGVRKEHRGNKWSARFMGIHCGSFDVEEHAAYAYDLAAINHFGPGANTNGAEEPDGWVPWTVRRLDSKGVSFENGKYFARFKNPETGKLEKLGTFSTREAARSMYNERESQFNSHLEEAHAAKEITKNAEGIAYLIAGDKEVLVSDEDWHEVTKYKWNFKREYPMTTVSRVPIRIHKFIMGDKEGYVVDHINGNATDNRRCNLRWTDHGKNGHNKGPIAGKQYKGTFRDKNKYTAQITSKGRRFVLGNYTTEALAALAYNCAARQFYGEHAYQNKGVDDHRYGWDQERLRLVRNTS